MAAAHQPVACPPNPFAAGLDEKERGYGEELVTAAVEALMRGAAGAGVQQRLAAMVQGVLALEAAQRRRKVSAPLRLAATALYSLLGASKLGAQAGGRSGLGAAGVGSRPAPCCAGWLMGGHGSAVTPSPCPPALLPRSLRPVCGA